MKRLKINQVLINLIINNKIEGLIIEVLVRDKLKNLINVKAKVKWRRAYITIDKMLFVFI